MERYKDPLQLLKKTAQRISSVEAPREVIEVVLNTFEKVLDYTAAAVVFFDESMSNLNIFRTKGMDEVEQKYVMERIPKLSKELIGMIEGNDLHPIGWDHDTVKKGVFFNTGKMKTFLWLPVIAHKKPIGVMSFSWRIPFVIDETLLEVFSILGNLLGGELQKLQRSFQTISDQKQKISALVEELNRCSYFDKNSFSVIGQDPKMREIYEVIMSVADTEVNVLIEGETGTGKEVLADYVHYLSHRNEGPIVKINCGALSETLLESELFGHVKGAFTGAYRGRMGRFEMAENGTLFLDEIGEMSKNMQVKLLRVLQEGTFERVGDSRSIRANVRIVCATNKNLKDAIKKREFRKDLYFRLNVISIRVPPLRERIADLPLFFNYFIDKFNKKYGLHVIGVNKQVLDKSYSYSWPGNVRELENVIERAVVTCKSGIIRDIDLNESGNPDALIFDVLHEGTKFPEAKKKVIESFERDYIINILRKNSGSITKSSRDAGLDRKNFYLKMKKYNITRHLSQEW